ncbi:MAG: hypothetical protein KGQ46_02035 [Hyphomicrobiales bacterium]|nr:hypothetical protein [Hyphomicrobiales bacterium]MDE2115541.1 hypothetical protein [Hyphomicrobiales bacterium]
MLKKMGYCLLVLGCFSFGCDNLAHGQLVLPGARTPEQRGAVAAPAKVAEPGSIAKPRIKASVDVGVLKAPDIKGVLGRPLQLNGRSGKLSLEAKGDAVNLHDLILTGTKISNPDQICQVSIVSGEALHADPVPSASGILHYRVSVPACPFEFDVLAGAVLVSPTGKTCKVVAADCAVDPSGMWGPPASSQGPREAKANETARAHAELEMREQFRALMRRTHGNANLQAAATEQAGFSSRRTTICRNYARDSVQDFCALKLTEARAIEINQLVRAAPAKKPKHGTLRRKTLRH